MTDILVTWGQDTDLNVKSYSVSFAVTPAGAPSPNPALVLSVPRSASGDAGGYSADYSALSPTPPTLNPGDSVSVSVKSIDTFGQESPPVSASGPGTVPLPAPPTGPVNVVAKFV